MRYKFAENSSAIDKPGRDNDQRLVTYNRHKYTELA
jgi:hypothetical protein